MVFGIKSLAKLAKLHLAEPRLAGLRIAETTLAKPRLAEPRLAKPKLGEPSWAGLSRPKPAETRLAELKLLGQASLAAKLSKLPTRLVRPSMAASLGPLLTSTYSGP